VSEQFCSIQCQYAQQGGAQEGEGRGGEEQGRAPGLGALLLEVSLFFPFLFGRPCFLDCMPSRDWPCSCLPELSARQGCPLP